VTASEDCTLKVWDVNFALKNKLPDNEPIFVLRGHTGPIISMTGTDLKSNRDTAGTVFSGSFDGNLIIWSIPADSFYNFDDPYLESEDSSIAK